MAMSSRTFVVQFSVGNANKGGDIAVQVQQGVHLHGGLVLPEFRPRKKCQAQVDGGRVQSIQALVEVHAERLVGVERPRDFNQDMGQTRRRCASRVFRWRRPECCAPPCRETPGDRVSRSRIGGRLRCPAGSRGKSVARRPSPSTDPSEKASSAEDDRRNGPRISETPGEGDGRSTLRKRTGRCASLIVEKRGRGAPAQFSAARSSNRFPLKFPPRHWIERVCWPPQSTLPDTSELKVTKRCKSSYWRSAADTGTLPQQAVVAGGLCRYCGHCGRSPHLDGGCRTGREQRELHESDPDIEGLGISLCQLLSGLEKKGGNTEGARQGSPATLKLEAKSGPGRPRGSNRCPSAACLVRTRTRPQEPAASFLTATTRDAAPNRADVIS